TLQRDHERGDAALHVRRAATVEHAVANFRDERIAGPCLARPRRHHVGMAKQHQHRAAVTVRRPEVVDLTEAHVFASETGTMQTPADQRLAAGIVRGDRGARNQLAREIEDFAHVPIVAKRFLNPLSLKPCVMTPSSVTTTGRRTSCGYSRSSSFHSASDAAALRLSGSCRHVVDDLLISDSKPPTCRAQSTRVSGDGLLSR